METFLTEQEIEAWIEQTFQLQAKVSIVTSDVAPRQRAKEALFNVLRIEHKHFNREAITFPSPYYSLSHCGNISIAIGIQKGAGVGVGIDVEQSYPSIKSSRNFLTQKELAELTNSNSLESAHLQRLWVIKEAVYKADPHNQGLTLKAYGTRNPNALLGQIHTDSHCIHYGCIQRENLTLAIAIAQLSRSSYNASPLQRIINHA